MILVLGGTGTFGRNIVASLKSRGARFKVGTRSREKARRLETESVEFDWARRETYAPALAGVDTLFLLTPVGEQQVAWSHDVIQDAKAGSVRRIVKLSVAGAGQEPAVTLVALHRMTEKEIETSGLQWTFLRPNFLMQNFVNHYGVVRGEDSTVYLPNGSGKVSWVDARDVGEVAARVLAEGGHEGKAYTLTGAEALTTGEACALIAQGMNKRVDYVDIPEAAARDAMIKQGVPSSAVSALLELNAIMRNGWAEGVSPELGHLLGHPPRQFAQFAKDLASGT